MPNPIVIVVDAIIGAGKTTLIRECLIPHLTARGWRVTEVREPVDKWKETGRLQQFYKDPSRRGYQFQTMAFHDRIKEARDKFEKYKDATDIFILERSIFTDSIFMKMLFESGTIDQTEYEDYCSLWEMWKNLMPFQPDMFIYLKPSLTVCMDRLRNRNRDGEAGVSEDYQKKLEEKHDEFLGANYVSMGNFRCVPRILLNTDANFKDDKGAREALIDKIETAIKTIRERQTN